MALSASLLPGIFKCPRTQRTYNAPSKVQGRRAYKGYQRASSWKLVKTCQEEPVKGERSYTTTSKLSRKTYTSIASLVVGEVSITRALLSATSTSILNTSMWSLREKALQSIYILYQYTIKPLPIKPSIALLFNLLEKTQISPSGTIGRKARKSFTTASFIYPYRPEILLITSSRDSQAA